MADPDGEKISALGHYDVLMKFARTELRRKKLTDVTIVLGREEIAVHRLMLAAFSQYFGGIFTARPQGTTKRPHKKPVYLPFARMGKGTVFTGVSVNRGGGEGGGRELHLLVPNPFPVSGPMSFLGGTPSPLLGRGGAGEGTLDPARVVPQDMV